MVQSGKVFKQVLGTPPSQNLELNELISTLILLFFPDMIHLQFV